MLFGLVLLCIVLILIDIYFAERFEDDNGVKTLPGKLPLIGHCLAIAKSKDVFGDMVKLGDLNVELGNISKAFFGSHTIYVISDPDDAFTALNKCLKKMFMYDLIEPIFGKVLIAAEVPVWKRNKRILDTVFKRYNLDGYLCFFNHQARRLVDILDSKVGKGDVDLKEIITWNVLETTLQTTMGKVNSEEVINKKYAKAIDSLLRIIIHRAMRPWLFIDLIFNLSSYGKEFKRNLEIFKSQSEMLLHLRHEEYINRMKNEKEFKNKDPNFQSILEILIETNKGMDGDMYTQNEIRQILDNVMLAAFDTTTYELLFIMLCIGSHRDVQEKLLEEINQVVGNEEVNKDHLPRLTYLEAVIKEGLRLYPLGPIIGRTIDKKLDLRNISIKPGASVAVHIWAINRHKMFWGLDADEFRPERWLVEKAGRNPLALFFSFSQGRRSCIGKAYAMAYLKATLVPILRKFVLISDHKNVKIEWYITLKIISGHFIKLVLR